MTVTLQDGARRRFLLGAASVTAATLAGVTPRLARAEVPMPTDQAPHFYRFSIGEARATMVSDGLLPLPNPANFFLGSTADAVNARLSANFRSTALWELEQNTMVVTLNGKTVLFDTGVGYLTDWGPKPGKLVANLRAAGIDPAGIDAVVMSHAHIDHAGGIIDGAGVNNFPNAQFYLHETDFDFWTTEGGPAATSDGNKHMISHARYNLLPVRDRIVFFKDNEEFLPGVTAMHAPGHSPGHCIFVVHSGNDSFAYIGDLSHHDFLLLETPKLGFAADTDSAMAAETRIRMLDMLATDRVRMMAYHFPWPGIGNIVKQGDGFRYLAEPMIL